VSALERLDFPIVDTHLHVWDPARLRYPWLDQSELLNRPHLPADYNRACGPVRVEKMVFVQAECEFAQYQAEADWVAELAAEDPRIEGIVSWAPLERGRAARPELERLASNGLVRGIRRIIQFEPDPEFCLRTDFVEGVRMLAEFGMSFDICITHHHLPNTVELVRRCPNVRFILDHIGKPDIKHHVLDPWRGHVRKLASMGNVWCKMSGLVTEADHRQWTPDDLRPYIDHVLDAFGWHRVMFGGDWPVVCQAAEYVRWVEVLLEAVAGSTAEELRRLFRENAIAFYRLG